ncbi:MAG TPA: exopolysaccharide biosynthesis protein [Holophagaceae bacterium]|nr:exopolysaccharide biosynthesis protein [Holophagaceae bacterium]
MSREGFFELFESLLDREGTVTMGELLDRGGPDRVYGLGIVVLSATAFIPGVTNILALGIVGLGVQMVMGRARPWLPERLLRAKLHRGRIKDIFAKAGRFLERLGPRATPRPLPQRLMGFLVTWTALLLALPLLLPFSNLLPGAALLMMGIALLEDRPLAAWLGLGGSLATTAYFLVSFDLVMKGLRAALHFRHIFE